MFLQLVASGSGPHDHLINRALDNLKSFGGGTLNLSGTFQLTRTIIIPDNIILRGDGTVNLCWSTDLGLGIPAIQSDPNSSGEICAAKLEYIKLIGPGFRSPTTPIGTQLAQMDGFAPGPCVDLYECVALNFRAGVVIRYDHNTFTRCKFSNNYYNVYFADKPKTLGNHQFIGCWLDGPLFASVAVAGDNIIGSCNFVGGHMGFGPYCLYKFDGPSGPSTQGFIHDSHFDNVSFEATGNAAILDESTGTPNGEDSLFGVVIDQCCFMWNPGYKIASRSRDWAMDVRMVKFTRYHGGSYPFLAGDKGTFNMTYGDIDIDIGQTDPAWNNMFGNIQNGSVGVTTVRLGRQWEGKVYQNTSGQYIKRGMPLELGGSWFQVNPIGMQTNAFYGVAMNNAPIGAPIVVATKGTVPALCSPISFCGTPLSPVNGLFSQTNINNTNIISIGNGGSPNGDLVTITLR